MRPDPTECAPYYHRYIERVPDGDVVSHLSEQFPVTRALLERCPGEQETRGYAPGKWSVRESVGHLIDAERVFAHRALWFARSAPAELPGMEQDDWIGPSGAQERPLSELLDEWQAVRAANVRFFDALGEREMARTGRASGVEFTVRSLAWIIAGHELHHRALFETAYGLGREGPG